MSDVWECRRMNKGEVAADPIQEEFFSEKEPRPDGIVREGVQNTLDAMAAGEAKVRVRYTFSRTPLPGAVADRYLSGLRSHLEQCVSALPASGEPMHYVVVEDFGTRGLTGDPEQYTDDPGAAKTKNDFYYFWRNVGRSSKSDTDRGRWGLGKTVFPAASRIHSFWGLTVRRDDGRTFLMGQGVLNVHMLGGHRYAPYAYFGSSHADGFCMPVEEPLALEEFRKDFGLSRNDEPGLSVVIPFPAEDITAAELIQSSIRNYFFPILQGSLVIEVCHDGKLEIIDSSTIGEMAAAQEWSNTSPERLAALFDLTVWALGHPEAEHINLRDQGDAAPAWSEKLFDGHNLSELRRRFESNERLAFRVPVQVARKGQPAKATYFDLYVGKDPSLDRGEDHYIRQGITISEIRLLREPGVRGMVVVRDEVLSALLGDSEGPAHTDWYERQRKLKERYQHGVSCIRFVRGSLREIVRLLARPPEGLKEDLLQDLFFVLQPGAGATSPAGAGTGHGGHKPGVNPPAPPPTPPPPAKSRFVLQQRPGGFTLGAAKDREPPKQIQFQAAYEVRRGDAFKRYALEDFDFAKDIEVEAVGATVKFSSGNQMVVEVSSPEFEVKVTGFDPNRDLKVRANEITAEEEG